MIRLVVLAACGLGLSGCGGGKCIGQGKNGVAAPDPDEFQLVFSNIVSRDTELVVDALDDDLDPVSFLLCEETEYVTVGNFPVSTETTLEIHSAVTDSACYASPCCDSNCDAQQCRGSPVIDTTPFAGRVYGTGLIWRL